MIISASYRTDIPAFYGEWFMNRLRAGYCKVVNPYGGQASRISLAGEDVNGFVFWTKNLRPFAAHLQEIRERGYPFVIQFGINAYPPELEASVVDWTASVELLRKVRAEYGPRVCVWRYDTIVVSSLTPVEFHLDNFSSVARALEGATDEVVISFLHPYKKTVRAMDLAAKAHGFTWRDPSTDEKKELASRLVKIAQDHSMQLSICAQREYIVPGASDARCVDAERLSDVAGRPIEAGRQGHRKECGCWESRDIGEYDTCPHGCVYCYAVSNRELAQERLRKHDPMSEFLISRRK
jgi:hypothetical protein